MAPLAASTRPPTPPAVEFGGRTCRRPRARPGAERSRHGRRRQVSVRRPAARAPAAGRARASHRLDRGSPKLSEEINATGSASITCAARRTRGRGPHGCVSRALAQEAQQLHRRAFDRIRHRARSIGPDRRRRTALHRRQGRRGRGPTHQLPGDPGSSLVPSAVRRTAKTPSSTALGGMAGGRCDLRGGRAPLDVQPSGKGWPGSWELRLPKVPYFRDGESATAAHGYKREPQLLHGMKARVPWG
jgi:hypothetical protein